VDQRTLTMTARQGELIVLQNRVSTGRPGHRTPNGHFIAGPRERMHYSRLYENAPMPYSVQVNGNVFIHGFSSVPSYPASHGCIRMPISS
ncbi:L,D-transpeptidase, partial [Pseudomonas aeruginosa]